MMKIIKHIILISFMFVCLGFNLIKTYALENVDIYGSESGGNLSYKNYINYKTSNGGLYTTTLGTTVSEANYGFSFYINKSAQINKVYKLRLNFNDYDYLHTNTYEVIRINSCEVVGYELKNIGSNTQARTVDIMYQCISPVSFLTLSVGLNSQRITTVDWRLNSVQWEEIDSNEDIIINNNQNTENIINNQEQNTQDLIDNQNAIAEQQEEQQKVCKNIEIKNGNGYENELGYLKNDGTIQSANDFKITDFIMIEDQEQYNISLNYSANSPSYCLYNEDKTLISCSNYGNNQDIYLISVNAYYIRYSFRTRTTDTTSLKGKICKNGNQAISDELNELNNNLTNDSPVDLSSLNGTAGWLPPGPVDSIINLPLTMLQNIYNSLSTTCFPLIINLPYTHQTVTIPCLSAIFGQIEGLTTFWAWVGTIASVVILYSYLINLYNYYDKLTTLQANYLDDFGGTP